jgi:hypothetical protein
LPASSRATSADGAVEDSDDEHDASTAMTTAAAAHFAITIR